LHVGSPISRRENVRSVTTDLNGLITQVDQGAGDNQYQLVDGKAGSVAHRELCKEREIRVLASSLLDESCLSLT
jgi:hypothetical protein